MKTRSVIIGMVLVLVTATLAACTAGPAPSPTAGTEASKTAGQAAPAAAGPATVIKVAVGFGPDQSTSRAMKWWGDEIEGKSQGRIKVEWYWGEQLAKYAENLQAVGQGLADAGVVAAGYYPTQLPLTAGAELTFVTDKFDARGRAMLEMYRSYAPFQKEWDAQKVRLVVPFSVPPTQIISRMPINTLEDLKGKKLRSYGRLSKVLENLGATPVAIVVVEAYESLQRGVIDGATGVAADQWSDFKLQESAKYIVDPGFGTYALPSLVMNKDVYAKLPKDLQAVIDEAASQVHAKHVDLVSAKLAEQQALFDKAGVEIIRMSDSELQAVRTKAQPESLWDEWIKETEAKGAPAKEFFDEQLKAVAKYEPSSTFKNPFR